MSLTVPQRSLIVAGAVLFLLGLLQGAGIQAFANPRMALSAHLTAVQSGLALMVVGIVWPALSLGPRAATIARSTMIAGIYGLWLGLTLAAATGASETLPIAGAGHVANPAIETVVSGLVLASSGLILSGWIVFVVGLVRPRRTDRTE